MSRRFFQFLLLILLPFRLVRNLRRRSRGCWKPIRNWVKSAQTWNFFLVHISHHLDWIWGNTDQKDTEFRRVSWLLIFERCLLSVLYQALHKIWQNTNSLWLVFSCIREKNIKIWVRENMYSNILKTGICLFKVNIRNTVTMYKSVQS